MSDLPVDVKEIFGPLSNEILWINAGWNRFKKIYCGDEESLEMDPRRIELLTAVASTFFGELQGTLLDSVVLGISRLLDPKEMGPYENFVLERLEDRVRERGDVGLANQLAEERNDLKDYCEPLRDNRDKKIAHWDRDFDAPGTIDLRPDRIEGALSKVADFMNKVKVHYTSAETGYQAPIVTGDADALIVALKKAVDYDDAVDEGEIPRDRLRNSRYWDA